MKELFSNVFIFHTYMNEFVILTKENEQVDEQSFTCNAYLKENNISITVEPYRIKTEQEIYDFLYKVTS